MEHPMRLAAAAAALLAAACSALLATGGGHHRGARVQPPAGYALPAEAVRVSTASALAAALDTPGRTIVLADGRYDWARPLSVGAGTRLYAEHEGRAVLQAGVSVGRGAAVVRGIAFDISDGHKTHDRAAISVWGAGQGTSVEDVSIEGNRKLSFGLLVRAADGFVGRRIVARNLTSDGIVIDTYPRRVRFVRAPVLSDLDVAHVARPRPRSSNGTSEACLWLAVTVSVDRARVRDCAWTGVWVGFNAVGGHYDTLDIDGTPVGVYLEHYTTASTFSHLFVGHGVRVGVNCEWADPAYGRRPASVRNVIRDSVFESYETGVFMDEGTRLTSVVDSSFRGQRVAGIVDFRGRGNSYRGNDYAGITSPGVAVSHDHG